LALSKSHQRDQTPSDEDSPEGEQDEQNNEVGAKDPGDSDTNATNFTNGRKRAHSEDDADDGYERARKIARSKGRPKASDYARDVQEVIDTAIAHYKVDLLRWDPYPDHTHSLDWATDGWGAANELCGLNFAHTPELIKMVSPFVMSFRLRSSYHT
jgi:hypothetical protein